MKIKKITIILILIIYCFSIVSFARENGGIDNVDRYNIVDEAFSKYMKETYQSENTPENEKILEFKRYGGGYTESNEKYIVGTVRFKVTPASDNSIWGLEENTFYIEMENINGTYEITYIGDTPKNYDKFLEEFEKYKAEKVKNRANVEENNVDRNLLENTKNDNKNIEEEILTEERITIFITIFCSAVLLITIIILLINARKKYKNKIKNL